MPTPPRPLMVSMKVSANTAHLSGLDKADTPDVGPGYCQILVKHGDRLTHLSTATGIDTITKMWSDTHLTRCTACATALAQVARGLAIAALDAQAARIVGGSKVVTDADVADLFTFDPDAIRQAALSAVGDALANLTTDGDVLHVLSPAAAADDKARADFYAHIDAMRKVMRTALADAGYGNLS